jgi:hypothetical protein
MPSTPANSFSSPLLVWSACGEEVEEEVARVRRGMSAIANLADPQERKIVRVPTVLSIVVNWNIDWSSGTSGPSQGRVYSCRISVWFRCQPGLSRVTLLSAPEDLFKHSEYSETPTGYNPTGGLQSTLT